MTWHYSLKINTFSLSYSDQDFQDVSSKRICSGYTVTADMLPVHYSLPNKVFHPLPAHSLSSVARMQVCSTFLHSQINITRESAHCLLLSTTFNIHLYNHHKQWAHLGSVLSLWTLIQILIGRVRSHLVYLYFLPVDGKVHSDTVGPETLQACCHMYRLDVRSCLIVAKQTSVLKGAIVILSNVCTSCKHVDSLTDFNYLPLHDTLSTIALLWQ